MNILISYTQTVPRTFTLAVSGETLREQARLLKALADEHRLLILHLLLRHSPHINVADLTECLALEQPTVSHHLRILRDARVIDCRRKGLYSYYYVKPDMLYLAMAAIGAVTPEPDAQSEAG